MTDPDISFLKRQVSQLQQDMRLRPVLVSPSKGGAVQPVLSLVILNGNDLGGGVLGIAYAGSVTLSSEPDISVDTTVPDGLGRALLYSDGVPQGRVWVRHDRGADVIPLASGTRRRAVTAVSISYGTGSISAYRWDY